MRHAQIFADICSRVAKIGGRPTAFVSAAAVVLIWGMIGPLLRFSDTWQLIMNTVSSIVTFLMVFLIQNTQARDSEAIHAKLDTLIAGIQAADDRYIGVERLPNEDIEALRDQYGPEPAARDG